MIPAPAERESPGFLLPDRQMLETWLAVHRATLQVKVSGLTDSQLRRRSVPPSSMSLIGLLRHLTEVERSWFQNAIAGRTVTPLYYDNDTNPDGDFDDVDGADGAPTFAAWQEAVATSEEITAGVTDLDAPGLGLRHGQPVSLRWVLVHLIEEYARHNGHADLLRECVDGQTGE